MHKQVCAHVLGEGIGVANVNTKGMGKGGYFPLAPGNQSCGYPQGERLTASGLLVSVLKMTREEGLATINNCQFGVEHAWWYSCPKLTHVPISSPTELFSSSG